MCKLNIFLDDFPEILTLGKSHEYAEGKVWLFISGTSSKASCPSLYLVTVPESQTWQNSHKATW